MPAVEIRVTLEQLRAFNDRHRWDNSPATILRILAWLRCDQPRGGGKAAIPKTLVG